MADLTGKTLANGYPNLVTIGATTNDNPTSGTLENGKGNNLTSVTFDGAVVVNESGGNNDFRVEGDTDANLIFADASTDRVGIGTSSPAKKLTVSGSGRMTDIELSQPAINNIHLTLLTSNTPVFTAKDSGSEIVLDSPVRGRVAFTDAKIRASEGVLFGSDTADANALDDYEEGTWTPVYEPSSGTFTTMTMDVISATYTKIGRQVTVIANIRTDNVDATGASGNLQIGGLPFTPGSLGFSAISIGRSIAFVNAPDSGVISNNSSKIFLRKNNTDSSSVVGDLTTGAIADRNNLELTATYFTS